MPNASSSTLAIGTKQLVVQLAFENTLWTAGSKSVWFTPYTNVASAPDEGALTITYGAPASRWIAALARSVNRPVLSITMSTPRSPQGSSAGLRTDSTLSRSPSTVMPSLCSLTVLGNVPTIESYLS